MRLRSGALWCALMAVVTPASAQPHWSATILHPNDSFLSEVWALAPGQQGGLVRPSVVEDYHAALWDGSGPWTDLGLGGRIFGMSAARQVGDYLGHASLWSGTPESRVELFNGPSSAYAISGNQQVGFAFVAGEDHASLWSGSAASWIDLNPPTAIRSSARATDGTYQWGGAVFPGPSGQVGRALRWSGTPSNPTDFTPPGAQGASINGVGGSQQVGASRITPLLHATIWNGTPESWQDIHPFPGFGDSELLATTGSVQVGWSAVPGFGGIHAGVWFGTAASFTDLTQFLPPGFGGESSATSVIIDQGRIIIGGYADGPSGQHQAVIWARDIPAPSAPLALAGLLMLTPRRRRRGSSDKAG